MKTLRPAQPSRRELPYLVVPMPGRGGGACAEGMVYGEVGDPRSPRPLLTQAVEQFAAMGQMVCQARRVAWLSETQLLAGHIDEAMPLAQRALELSHAHKERGHQAWILRLLGDIAVQCDPPQVKQSEAHYQQALALAEELGMRPLQAHCHRSLGTLYARIGQLEQVRAALATAIALYCAMDMTFRLPQAEAALGVGEATMMAAAHLSRGVRHRVSSPRSTLLTERRFSAKQ